MACSLQTLAGLARNCGTSLAGIKEVYIADFNNVTVTKNDETRMVSGITMASGTSFYAYHFNKQTGSLTSTLTKDETNGTRYYTNEIALQFSKMETRKHLEIEALAAGQLAVVVLDNNNKLWYVGYDSYVSSTEGTAQTGQSFDDLSGYNLTMSAMSAFLPFEISSEYWNTFKATNVIEPEEVDE